MKYVFSLIIVAVILYFFIRGGAKEPSTNRSSSIPKEQKLLKDNSGWMEARWATARNERNDGGLKSVPGWFFDEVTERQLEKIDKLGLDISGGRPTKGEASDVIGLFRPAEDKDKEVLRFFGVSLKGTNQSKARDEVSRLLNDPQTLERWKNRPAASMQKEFYRSFMLKVPRGLTHEEALQRINDYRDELSDEDEGRLEEWDAFEDIYEEVNDPEFREDYELKKIGLSLYRSAIDQLKKEGKSLTEQSSDPDLMIDSEMVVEKTIEMRPEIQRNRS